jgi:hypothetical protein
MAPGYSGAGAHCSQIPHSTISDHPCPTQNRVGSCSINQAGWPGEFIQRFYSPLFNAATAQNACTTHTGAWIP